MTDSIGLGVIEGFYGRPWTQPNRLAVLQHLGAAGLQTYLHAPKQEREDVTSLRRPVPPHRLGMLEELAAHASACGVRFIHGLSPFRLFDRASLPFLRREHLEFRRLLAARVKELSNVGVRDFAILFDDTWPTIAPQLANEVTGQDHGALVREAEELLGRKNSLVVVPAVYFGRASSLSDGARRYLSGLRSQGAWLTAWTGPGIFSSYISEVERGRLERCTGLSIWIWSNAIANDWLPLATGEPLGLTPQEKLCFGPVHTVSPQLLSEGRGVLLNGAREFVPTLVALHMLSDLRHTMEGHQPDTALERGVKAVCGSNWQVVLKIAESVGPHELCFPQRFRTGLLERLVHLPLSRRRTAALDALGVLANTAAELNRATEIDPRLVELQGTALRITEIAYHLTQTLLGRPSKLPTSSWRTALDPYIKPARLNELLRHSHE